MDGIEDNYRIFRNLEDAKASVFDENQWPILMHLAFDPPLASQICPSLLELPSFPFVSQSMHTASLPKNCLVSQERYGLADDLKVFPLETFLGRDLLSKKEVAASSLNKEITISADDIENEASNFEDIDLENFEFSVRTYNVFQNQNISTIKELIVYTERELLKFPNFGRKSLREVNNFLKGHGLSLGTVTSQVALLGEKSRISQFGPSLTKADNIIDNFTKALGKLDKRSIQIINRRSGYGCSPETLEEIGESETVTRERIRQIEAKAIRKLKHPSSGWNPNNFWGETMEKVFLQVGYPVTIEFIKTTEPGINFSPEFQNLLLYIFEKLLPKKYYHVDVSGSMCLIRLQKEKLTETRQSIVDLLSKSEGHTISSCLENVRGIVPSELAEFTQTLFNSCLEHSIISKLDGEDCLSYFSPRRSGLSAARDIFENNSSPLTNEEIAKIIERDYPDLEFRNVANYFQKLPGVFPFRHGVWGTLSNLNLSDNELLGAKTMIRQTVREMEKDQFHSNEIFEIIQNGDPTLALKLDGFKVAGLIREYCDIQYIGRSMFSTDVSMSEERIKLRDLTIQILSEAGKPMHANDIKNKMREVRSFGKAYQITPKSPIILLGAGIFALEDMEFQEVVDGFLYRSKIDGQEKLMKVERIGWNPDRINWLTELENQGHTITKIAEIMNVSSQTISKKMKEIGMKSIP